MQTVVKFDHVTKLYGRQVALTDVSFEVPSGVVFALLGENGAGKTTAIRVLLGLADADDGAVRTLGLDSRKQSLEIRRRVGYVPERPTLYEWMTVAEIGWFAAGFHEAPYFDTYRERVRDFSLPEGKKIAALSKGMRAKVVLALALANDPELLILDEPTSGLDPLVRRAFLESMVDRAAAGKTVLLSSHQIGAVERVADWVGILHRGRVRLVTRLDQLKASVREITVTLEDDSATPPDVPGEILRKRRRARQWQLLVAGVDEMTELVPAGQGVVDAAVRTPSLEEIFIAYVGDEGGQSESENPAHEVVL